MSNARENEQLDLFAPTSEADPYTPPPHIDTTRCGVNGTNYTQGCRCGPCSQNRSDYHRALRSGQRICAYCNEWYPRTKGGTKFCQTCIDAGVYTRAYRNGLLRSKAEPPNTRTCERCAAGYRPTRGGSQRWNICATCTQMPEFQILMGALGSHNAPTSLVVAVMDWPYCANEECGAWLLERGHHRRLGRHNYRYQYNFAVDHDHSCCPQDKSCGSCIRGVICRSCNNALPHTLDARRARGLADYMARSS